MTDGMGNAEQVRIVAEQVAEIVFLKVQREQPKEATIPPPLKWAGMVAGSILAMGAGAIAIWLVSTTADIQVILAKMDVRTQMQDKAQEVKFEEIDRRLLKLEAYHTKPQ